MLILTRRIGETLFFELPTGDRIEVAVLRNKGSQVRVGIEAPVRVLPAMCDVETLFVDVPCDI